MKKTLLQLRCISLGLKFDQHRDRLFKIKLDLSVVLTRMISEQASDPASLGGWKQIFEENWLNTISCQSSTQVRISTDNLLA